MRASFRTTLALFGSAIVLAVPVSVRAQAAPAATKAAKVTKNTSVCKDGTRTEVVGKGICSGHGGVDAVATSAVQKDAKAAKAEKKATKAAASGDTAKAAAAQSKAKTAQAKAQKAEAKAATDSTGATMSCKDGTYSHAKTKQGACSGHGGVAKVLKP